MATRNIDAIITLKDMFSPTLQKIQENIKETERVNRRIERQYRNLGRTVSSVGQSILKATAPFVALGTVAMAEYQKVEEARASFMALTVNDTQILLEMEETIDRLADKYGKSRGDMYANTEALYSAGITDAERLKKALKAVNDLSMGAGMATAGATQALTQLSNIWGSDPTELANQLALLKKNGNIKNEQIEKDFARSAGVARFAGFSQETHLAAMTGASMSNANMAENNTAMASLINALSAPSEQLKEISKLHSFSIDTQQIENMSLHRWAKEVATKLSPEELQKAFPSETGRQMILALSTDKAQEAADSQLADMQSEKDFLSKSVSSKQTSPIEKMRASTQRLKNSLEKFIPFVVPYIDKTAKSLSKVARVLNGLSPTTKKLVVNTTLFAVSLGTILTVVGPLITRVGRLIILGRKLKVVYGGLLQAHKVTSFLGLLKSLTKGFRILSITAIKSLARMSLALVTTPIGLLLLGVAIAIGVIIYKWDELKKKCAPAIKFLSDSIRKIIKSFTKLYRSMIKASAEANRSFGLMKTVIGVLIDIIAELVSWIIDIFAFLAAIILSTISNIVDIIAGMFEGLSDIIGGHVDLICALLEGDIAGAGEAFMGIFYGMGKCAQSVLGGIANMFVDLVNIGIKAYNMLPTTKQKVGLIEFDGLEGGFFDTPDATPSTREEAITKAERKVKKPQPANPTPTPDIDTSGIGGGGSSGGGGGGGSSSGGGGGGNGGHNTILNIAKIADSVIIRDEADIEKIAYEIVKRLKIQSINRVEGAI